MIYGIERYIWSIEGFDGLITTDFNSNGLQRILVANVFASPRIFIKTRVIWLLHRRTYYVSRIAWAKNIFFYIYALAFFRVKCLFGRYLLGQFLLVQDWYSVVNRLLVAELCRLCRVMRFQERRELKLYVWVKENH